jgi:hypothetical protein
MPPIDGDIERVACPDLDSVRPEVRHGREFIQVDVV